MLSKYKNKDGARMFVLLEYNFWPSTLISVGRTRLKVEYHDRMTTNPIRAFAPEKCALPDELICIVWETWRGKNGRGGYRIERNLYPKHRIRADRIERQSGAGRVCESSFGVLEKGD